MSLKSVISNRMIYSVLAVLAITVGAFLLQSLNGEAQSGSALIINAHATPLNRAAPNNINTVAVYVTVQSSTGLVTGLDSADFIVFAEELPADGCLVGLLGFRTTNNGVYRVDIAPGNLGCTWERGRYVFSVSVRNGSQSGAALTELNFE